MIAAFLCHSQLETAVLTTAVFITSFFSPLYFFNLQNEHNLLLPTATQLRKGNVFTPVCDSVHGRGGLCSSMHHRSHDQGGLCPRGGGLCTGESLLGGWESLSRGWVSVHGGLCSGGSLSKGVSVRETPLMVTSRWYASYWNAFLFVCDYSRYYHHFGSNVGFV